MINDNLGIAVRNLRTKKNMTLKELAEQTELSISYLSLLERGQCNPTISNVNRICNALNVTMANLLNDVFTDADLIVKKENRKILFKSSSSVMYESLTNNRPLSGICMVVQNNDLNISDPHSVDEFGYIISGSMIMTVNGNDYMVSPGDSIYIPANSHHSFQKISEEDSASIWVYAPQS